MGEEHSRPKPCSALSPQARIKQTALVNFAAALERADEQVLPSVYAFVSRCFGSTPAQLGLLTLARALAQALASPLGGVAGHCAHRGRVIGTGCLLWALCAAAFAFSSSIHASLPLWALGGVGLALVVPSTQSLVADMSADAHRGRAFGAMHLASATGGMLGALLATNLGAMHLLGIEGWRLAFLVMAAVR
jgi:MFS family permease